MPDIFGFQTPEETQRALIQQFQEQYRSGRDSNAFQTSSGVQLGTSLAGIFGPTVKKALDTRQARQAETQALIARGTDPEKAKAAARQAITPEYREVRQAQQFQEIASQGTAAMSTLIEQGMPEGQARAVGMLQVARKLDAGGFPTEAVKLRSQAAQLLEAEEEKALKLRKAKADVTSVEDSNTRANTQMYSQDDTFVNFANDGTIKDVKSVNEIDIEERERLRQAGYINVGNSAFGVQLDASAFPGGKPIDQAGQDALTGGISLMTNLNALKNVAPFTGHIRGPYTGFMTSMGWVDPETGLYDAVAAQRKIRADIQSLIKGIPSNYDAGVFERIIPDPFAFRDENLYNSQVDLLAEETKRFMEYTLGFYVGTDRVIPPSLVRDAQSLGVDVGTVAPLNEQQYLDVTAAHQAELEAKANDLETRKKVEADTAAAQPLVVPGKGTIDMSGIRKIP